MKKLIEYKYIILFGLILFSVVNLCNFSWSVSKNITPIYSGVHADEIAYFMDIRSFQINNSLKTALTGDESISKIGQFSNHGYAYILLYGIFSKLFLGSKLAMLYANLVLLCITLIYLYRQKYSLIQKHAITLLVISYFTAIQYLETFMVEILNTSFALFLSLFLYKIYAEAAEQRKKKIILFFLFVLIASTFRQAYVFFLIGLFPLSTNVRSFCIYLLMLLIAVVYSIESINYFSAVYYDGCWYHVFKDDQMPGFAARISFAWEHAKDNLVSYFGYDKQYPFYYIYYKYVLVAITAAQGAFYYKTKNKIYLAPFLIGLAYISALLIFYDAFDWREHRSLTAVYIVNAVFFVLMEKRIIQIALVAIAFLSLPEVMRDVIIFDKARLDNVNFYASQTAAKNYFEKIKEYKTDKPIVTVQLPADFDYNYLYMLPLQSNDKKAIRYNLLQFKKAPEKSTFITHYWSLIVSCINDI